MEHQQSKLLHILTIISARSFISHHITMRVIRRSPDVCVYGMGSVVASNVYDRYLRSVTYDNLSIRHSSTANVR